ncbi:MAG: hypothetical protein FWF96_08060, partial [Kiritimatiellaeota bacterium]|nr:hypothetical protein [Kiritimatiellota bacterium]
MDIWTQQTDLVVTCGRDLLQPTMKELRGLGCKPYNESEVVFCVRGDMREAMRINLWSRCAHRVLYPVLNNAFARDLDEVYYAINNLPWELWLDPEQFLTVESIAFNDTCRDTRLPTLKTKDAIVDRLRTRLGRRPDTGNSNEGAAVYTYWNDTTLHCFIDTTGEPLSRRGYRREPWLAPMQETLAAAAVMATPYSHGMPLVMPMCGSGTLAIEAALLAKNRAPGALRNHFAFMSLVGFGDVDDWARVRKGLDRGWYRAEDDFTVTQIVPTAPPLHALKPSVAWNLMLADARRRERPDAGIAPIIATDIAPGAIEATRKNARAAGVTELLQTHVCDFADTPLPDAPAVIFMNPE